MKNGLRGSLKYKEIADKEGINHIFAIESDAGGFGPLGFLLHVMNQIF